MNTRNYGLIVPPIDTATNHIFGSARSLGGPIIQPDADWTPYLPADEFQDLNGIEPYACASFGTLNAVETLANKLYGFKDNWSDRFLAKNTGTDLIKGNDPHKVAETLRHEGVPVQAQWDVTPDINTFEKFYSDLTDAVKTLALQFPAEYVLGHEWVTTSVSALKNALKYSPLAISVYAWVEGPDGIYYKPKGLQDVHWCMLYKIEGDVGYVFDSYDNSHKKYRLDNVQIAKRYSLTLQVEKKSSAWANFLTLLVQIAYGLLPKKNPDTLPPPPTPEPLPPLKYLWDTLANIKHSVRVICDEEGLTLEQKNTLFATIWAESGFKLDAVNYNKVNGKVVSIDYGLCQWNDYYHRTEITPNEALHNPEKAVRLMCAYWRRGQRDLWIAYKSGAYEEYL